MRLTRLVCLLLVSLTAVVASSGAAEPKLSVADFEKKIERGVAILASDAPLSVEDATELVRLSNTVVFFKRAKTRLDEEFERLAWGRGFGDRLIGVFGEAIPNKGMGLYFKKPDLHWGGSGGNIRERDRFVLIE